MGSRIFVGNLPWDTGESELASFFGGDERVAHVRIMLDRDTGRSRGFAFVDMIDVRTAEEAIRDYDGRELHGRPLRVNEANERRPSGGNGYQPHGHSGGGERKRKKGKSRRRRDDDYHDRW